MDMIEHAWAMGDPVTARRAGAVISPPYLLTPSQQVILRGVREAALAEPDPLKREAIRKELSGVEQRMYEELRTEANRAAQASQSAYDDASLKRQFHRAHLTVAAVQQTQEADPVVTVSAAWNKPTPACHAPTLTDSLA